MPSDPPDDRTARRGRAASAALGFALTLVALAAGPVLAGAAPIGASGTVSGALRAGQPLSVRLVVTHDGGWARIEAIEVSLELRGVPLERIVVDPTHFEVVLVGEAGPTALGADQTLRGRFLEVDARAIAVSAQGNRLTLNLPVRVLAAPPAGARLVYEANGFDLSRTPRRALTPPVEASSGGISWGTVALVVAAALFAGGFVGNTFASRRRPPAALSVYAAVQRHLDEEKSAS